ncbi:MAG: toxin [Acinetobacter sp.]|jgi:uncharacterized protein YndB with AHSA1/START domain|nr:MAG: toxin [Acinetobacter sp.]
MIHSVVKVKRMLSAPIEHVYQAFADPVALVKWLPPRGYVMEVIKFDLYEQGTYHFKLTHFGSNQHFDLKGTFLEVIPNQKIVYLDQSDDDGVIVKKTIHFTATFMGTEFKIIQEGLPEQRSAEMYYIDWQDSLYLLSLLVEF